MVQRVGRHLRRKCDACEIEIIAARLWVGDRIRCAIQFFHGGRCHLGWLTEVRSGSKEEVEESRWACAACRPGRDLSAEDDKPLSGVELYGLAIERHRCRPRHLVDYAVGRRDAASLIWLKRDAHGFEMKRNVRDGWQFCCGNHGSCNCWRSGGSLCAPGDGKRHRAEQQ